VQPEFNLGNVRIKGLELPYRDLDWDQISPRNFPGLDAPSWLTIFPGSAQATIKAITEETTWDRDTKKLIVPQRTYAPSSLFYSLKLAS